MNKEELKKEITLLKEELRTSDDYYIKAVSDYNKLDDETRIKIEHLESQLEAIQEDGTEEHNNAVELRIKLAQALLELNSKANTFAICEETHYALEECRFRNLQLERDISDTDQLKSQITLLYSTLSKTDALWAQSQEKGRKWEEVATKLYSVALHLEEVAGSRCNIVVVGPGLYSEAVESIKEYERLQND